jgi:Domain of unknown function (DUF4149)
VSGAGWKGAGLRGGLWLLLGGWLGAWWLFAFSVARTAFNVLPPETAGKLVGPVLDNLHLFGGVAGVALALLARALGRGFWHQTLPLVMAGLCLFSQFAVTSEIERLRDLAFGPAADAATLTRFWQLHGASMAIYTVVGLLALVLTGLHAWADASGAEAPRLSQPPNPAKNRAESAKNA